jgi:hypothetical protein
MNLQLKEGFQINEDAVASNEKAIMEFLFNDSPASYIRFLLDMQEDFLKTKSEMGEKGCVQSYVDECLFDFKTLIELISNLQHPHEFIEKKSMILLVNQ